MIALESKVSFIIIVPALSDSQADPRGCPPIRIGSVVAFIIHGRIRKVNKNSFFEKQFSQAICVHIDEKQNSI